MVAGVDMLGCGCEQEPSDDDVDGLREDLLPHAQGRLGVELTLIEVDRLPQLEELLGLPAQVIELGYLRAREVRATQRGEVEGLLALGVDQPDRAMLDGIAATPRSSARSRSRSRFRCYGS
jgi:hypothetical protein